MAFKGCLQVYTGNGKGKTTAAIGLCVRALGAGMRVLLLQFMKSQCYSEHAILPGLSPDLTVETVGKPYFVAKEGALSAEELVKLKDSVVVFPPGKPPQEYRLMIENGVARAKDAVSSGKYDLVVLDEINVALFFELITFEQLREVIDCRLDSVELLLTGRGAPRELIDLADLVTEMKEIKHYYNDGLTARKGVEC